MHSISRQKVLSMPQNEYNFEHNHQEKNSPVNFTGI